MTTDNLQGMTIAILGLALFTAGVVAGRMSASMKLRDAQVIAEINAIYNPGTVDLILHQLNPPPAPKPVRTRRKPAPHRARTRFQRQPGEFPLLHNNPLVPLLTSPKTVIAHTYTDGRFVIITRNGAYQTAAFIPA